MRFTVVIAMASLEPSARRPMFAQRLIDSSLATWAAAARGSIEIWEGTLRRGASPLTISSDALLWWREMTERRAPTWSTENEIVLASDIANVRDFSVAGGDPVVPTLVLPPQAGHHSCIIDYSPAQSQLRVIADAGLTRLYAMEWLGATAATKDAGIEDYLAVVADAVEHAGGRVNLVGDCQGGWLATIFAALHPERVNTLTIAGAPIDFHAGNGVLHDYVTLCSTNALDRRDDMAFYRALVALGNGVLKGELMVGGFIAIKPEDEVERQLKLLALIDDPAHRKRYREFEDWFKYTQDIPGAFYLWIVENLFRDNALILGKLCIQDAPVDLRRIGCPLYLLAGAEDHITPAAQVFAAAGAVSTSPDDVVQRLNSGGHLGLFMGSKALEQDWPPILASVHAHSRLNR